jgi:gamma-glutamylcyclotransferase (GGCT)/AIG2-like uncharacterized protein YtfP
MSGYHNNKYLINSNYIGKAKTIKKYIMKIYDNIAYIAYNERLYPISGELYDIDEKTLEKIDQHEGKGVFYSRGRIKVTIEDGTEHICYTYMKIECDGIVSKTGNYRDDVSPSDFDSCMLFVYGTLMNGYKNSFMLDKEEFVGEGETEQKFTMKLTKNIPFVSENLGNCAIKGELYTIKPSTLFEIDQMEMNGSWYCRYKTNVIVDETRYNAYMYFCDDGEYVCDEGDYKHITRLKRTQTHCS